MGDGRGLAGARRPDECDQSGPTDLQPGTNLVFDEPAPVAGVGMHKWRVPRRVLERSSATPAVPQPDMRVTKHMRTV